jgi:hypothetical protein
MAQQTEKQRRQQRLYQLKGSLFMTKAILYNALESELSEKSKDELGLAYGEVCSVLRRFNKEVGWKE